MGGKKKRPPRLPANAPQELKDFVACTRMEVDLDPAQPGWLPSPPGLGDAAAPSVTITPNGANAVNVSVGWGFISITLPVSIEGGQLKVDTANLPDLGDMKSNVDKWVTAANDFIRQNGKELSGLELRDGKLHLTKRAVAAQHSSRPSTGRLVGAGVAVAALATGVGVWATGRDADAPSVSPGTGGGTVTGPAGTGDAEQLAEQLAQWLTCDPAELPCATDAPPLVVWDGQVAVSHSGSVPDAVTGRTGPSMGSLPFRLIGPPGEGFRITAETVCGGQVLTGAADLQVGGVTQVQHPFFAYGPCSVRSVRLDGPGFSQLLPTSRWGDYSVGPDLVPAPDITAGGFTTPIPGGLDAAGTVLNILGDRTVQAGCTWYLAPDAGAPDTSGCSEGAAVFRASLQNAWLLGHGGTRLTLPMPSVEELFANTVFPCGAGEVAFTVCPDAEAVPAAGEFVAVAIAVTDAVSLRDDGRAFTIDFGATEFTLVAADGEWLLSSSAGSATAARAIIRGNSLTLVVPAAELGSTISEYTLTSVTGDDPPITEPPTRIEGSMAPTNGGSETGQTDGAMDAAETPEEFFAALSSSIAGGDLAFALDRLHPDVLAAFSEEACRAELASRSTPGYEITVVAVGATEPWTYEPGTGSDYPQAQALTVSLMLPGVGEPVEGHLVLIDGTWRWFTICAGS